MIGWKRFGRGWLGLMGACGSLALFANAPSVAAAAPRGIFANLRLCLRGEWQHVTRANATPFANVGGCVSYAVRGGALTDPRGPAALDCDSVGGTFGSSLSGGANDLTGQAPAGGSVVLDFTCNGTPLTPSEQSVFTSACAGDAASAGAPYYSFVYAGAVPASSCFIALGVTVTS